MYYKPCTEEKWIEEYQATVKAHSSAGRRLVAKFNSRKTVDDEM